MSLLTSRELAQVKKISRATVSRLMRAGLPFQWVGAGLERRAARFDLAAVDRWLEQRQQELVKDWTRFQRRRPA